MPIRCGNTTKSGKLLFRFPKGPGRAAAVGPLRAGPPANWYRGSDSSVICSEHFAPACFDVSSVIQKNLPFSERLRPVAGAASILHSVSSLLKPTGKKEGDSGRPEKGGKPQAVRQPQATPGPASCTRERWARAPQQVRVTCGLHSLFLPHIRPEHSRAGLEGGTQAKRPPPLSARAVHAGPGPPNPRLVRQDGSTRLRSAFAPLSLQ